MYRLAAEGWALFIFLTGSSFGGIVPDTHPEYNFGHPPYATQSSTHTRTILWQLDPRSLLKVFRDIRLYDPNHKAWSPGSWSDQGSSLVKRQNWFALWFPVAWPQIHCSQLSPLHNGSGLKWSSILWQAVVTGWLSQRHFQHTWPQIRTTRAGEGFNLT